VWLSPGLSSCVLHHSLELVLDLLTHGGLILSASVMVSLQPLHSSWALTSASHVSWLCLVASFIIFITCMLSCVPWICMMSSLWRLRVCLLIDAHIAECPVVSLDSQCQGPQLFADSFFKFGLGGADGTYSGLYLLLVDPYCSLNLFFLALIYLFLLCTYGGPLCTLPASIFSLCPSCCPPSCCGLLHADLSWHTL
jgi:hypothetical protein